MFESLIISENLLFSHNIHIFHSFHGYEEFNKLACSQCMGLHSSVGGALQRYNAEAMGSNPVEAPKTFFGLSCDCLNRKQNCDNRTFI